MDNDGCLLDGKYLQVYVFLFLGLVQQDEICLQVFIPSFATGWWCLYVWDLFNKKIHILDPVVTNQDIDTHLALHDRKVEQLHGALCSCKDRLFDGWDERLDDFEVLIHLNMNIDIDRYIWFNSYQYCSTCWT